MQCSCGTANAPNAKFCKNCGTPVQMASSAAEAQVKSCPSCSTQLKSNAKFCGKCGHKFSDSAALSPAAPMERTAPVVQVEPNEMVVQPLKVEVVTAQTPSITQIEDVGASKGNKKFIIIGVVLFLTTMVAAVGWYFIWAPKKDVLANEATVQVATTGDTVPVASPEATVPGNTNVLPSSYLGKTAKLGTMLGAYMMESTEQTKNFMIMQGFDDEGHKLIVVTDLAGKVVDTKEIPEIDKAFISSKQACVVNKKPYAGVYVAATLKKLTQPTEIWKLTEDGRLINESVANLECAYYPECEPESDVCFDIGYNDKHKQELPKQSAVKQATAKPKVQAKKESAQKPEPSNTTQHHEPSATEIASTTTEPVQQQEVTQEEPKKKKKNFFETLEESVKNGATETTCTGAQRALNQCN
jgi:Double zinc ribbon